MELRKNIYLLLIISVLACSPPIKRAEDPSLSYRILYISNPDENSDIYSIDLHGGNPVQLTENTGMEWSPRFQNHDGKITFNSTVNDRFGIYTMNCDGTNQVKSTIQKNDNYSLSPNGEWILYTEIEGDNSEVYVQQLTDSKIVNISNHPEYDGRPVWSPDGSQIAFISERDGDAELFMVNADGSGMKQLTSNSRREKYLDWKYDGTSIFISSEFENEDSELFEIFIDGRSPIQLTDNDYNESEISASPYNYSLVYRGEGIKKDQLYWLNLDSWEHTQLTYDDQYHGEPSWAKCSD